MSIDHALHSALLHDDDPPPSPRMAKLIADAREMFPDDDDALIDYVMPIINADPELTLEALKRGARQAIKQAKSELNN